ncbi:hypothetical protein VUR80DRAFT_8589 [Thermomyces stellatus]
MYVHVFVAREFASQGPGQPTLQKPRLLLATGRPSSDPCSSLLLNLKTYDPAISEVGPTSSLERRKLYICQTWLASQLSAPGFPGTNPPTPPTRARSGTSHREGEAYTTTCASRQRALSYTIPPDSGAD